LVVVPELNFFAVLRQSLNGRREIYQNIRIHEPSPELFGPPADARVFISDKPSGLIKIVLAMSRLLIFASFGLLMVVQVCLRYP
jgi:hypothetical protein